ncbi:hypothetical protein RB595_008402 [Gaeumannomyces hyphopodioides]
MAAGAAVQTPAAPRPPGQPDITYAPDIVKYQQRTARRLRDEVLSKELPEGFPAELEGDLVWEGETLVETYDWTYVLSPEQLAEIDAAVKHFKSLDLPLGHIDTATFPLPSLHGELRRLSRELHLGRGFFVIRGVPADAYSREDNVIIYAGVSSHVAAVRGRQDHVYEGKAADVALTHIVDLSSTTRGGARVIGSPAYTTDKQVFHTDSGDIVSLFALGEAASGGASKLASTWRVYNELARTRPDLVRTLAEDWPVENFDKSHKDRYFLRPLIYHQPAPADGTAPERVLLQYARRTFVGFGALPRGADVPALSEAQAEALDALHFLGERFHVATDFRKGDMQYVNNVAVFHARDAFTDTPEKQRHLVRLWLRDPEYAWDTPEKLRQRWEGVYAGVTAEAQVFPLEPFVRGAANGGGRKT